jgi:hypothetical protein
MGLSSTTCCQVSRAGQGSTRREAWCRRWADSPADATLFGNPDELLESISLCFAGGWRESELLLLLPTLAGGLPAMPCHVVHRASARLGGANPPAAFPLRVHLASPPAWVVVWMAFLLGSPLRLRPATASSSTSSKRHVSVEPRRRPGQGGEKTKTFAGVLPSPRPAVDASTAPTREADQREHSDVPEMTRQDTGSRARHVFAFNTHLGNASWGIVRPRDGRPAKHWIQCPCAPSGTGGRRGPLEVVSWEYHWRRRRQSEEMLPSPANGGEDVVERQIPRIGSPCSGPDAREWPGRVVHQISNGSNSSTLCY